MLPAAGALAEDNRSDRRRRLKAATADAHARLAEQLAAARMLDTMPGYRRYLEATFEIRSTVEREMDLVHAERLMPLWPQRRIAGLVAADIIDMGGWVSPPRAAEDMSGDQTVEGILGALYVLEEVSLGARGALRQVQALGVTALRGGRHLSAQCGDAAAWRQLMGVLNHDPMSPLGEAACTRSALAMYQRFGEAYLRHALR